MSSSQSGPDRLAAFRGYVSALNQQFVEWCQQQWQRKPEKFWASGLHDYLRHTAKIRREFADLIENTDDSTSTPGGTPPPGSAERPRKYEPLLSLTPYCNTKVIHFIRHGEGFHNVGIPGLDSHLTATGWEQAAGLGRHLYSMRPGKDIELVIVSPMMRALETAAGVFGMDPAAAAAAAGVGDAGGGGDVAMGALLMAAQTGEPSVRVARPAVAARPNLTFVAQELCRERLGGNVCDKRRPLGESAAAFPGVDFSLVESAEDAAWEAGRVEPEASVVARGMKFLQYLMSRPEQHIAVVTHSAFLWFTLTTFGNEFAKPVRENLQRWYENCECRTVVLGDGGGAGAPDRTWFRGGEAWAEPQRALLKP